MGDVSDRSADGCVIVGDGQTQRLTVGGIVLFGDIGGVLNRHGGNVRALGQDLDGHLAGGVAKVVVADGQGGNAAAAADALLAGDSGNLGGQQHVGDGFGVGSGGVVSGDVDDVGSVSGGLCHRGDIVGVGEGKAAYGEAHIGQVALHDIALVYRVRLGAAVQKTYVFGVGEQLLDHGCLLVQRCQIGRAGDVVAHGTRPVGDVQRGGVVGDRGTQHGDGGGSLCGSLQGRGGVCQNQVNVVGNKAVYDGGAVGGIARGVLLVKLDGVAQLGGQGVLEALRGGVQCHVLHQLADADGVGLGSSAVCRRSSGRGSRSRRGRGTAASGKGGSHCGGHGNGNDFFHILILPNSAAALAGVPTVWCRDPSVLPI